MSTCSVHGCERRRYAKALCVMHYTRARRGQPIDNPASLKGKYGDGSVDTDGYRVIHLADHPLSNRQGRAAEHRVVLYDAIGPGPHPCHWCGSILPWRGRPARRICVDHLDENTTNNEVTNLVPSCLDCNTKRSRRVNSAG